MLVNYSPVANKVSYLRPPAEHKKIQHTSFAKHVQ